MRTSACVALLALGTVLNLDAVLTAQEPRLRSRFAAEVDTATPHQEYPRPKLVRESWHNLNGTWELAITPDTAIPPGAFEHRILVPFCIESTLGGVGARVGADQRAWYRRRFEVPASWDGMRCVLHFGAVDWHAEVRVDGTRIGEHRGGYTPFSLEIGPALDPDRTEHELLVAVWDPTDAGEQPRGKQVRRPHGIWYTPTTGIWQTVWLEPLPPASIDRVVPVPDLAGGALTLRVDGTRTAGLRLVAVASADGREVARGEGPADRPLRLAIPEARAWSPEDPFLYGLRLELRDGERLVDAVRSDFGMRSIEVTADADGIPRILLNGEPRFMLGLLDQGFWPDGLYTPPTDAALRYDLEVTRRLGYDTVRKHVKVESQRFYHWCDRLGLLVWQDMPSSGPYIGADQADAERDAQSARQWRQEAGELVAALEMHPSIVMWVPFNEGWGQFATEEIAAWFAARDPSRLVDATSGWADRGVGHVRDLHSYPGPGMPPVEERRAAVLGEFGGLGLPVAGHTWQDEANWGYRSFTSRASLGDAYARLIESLPPLIARGLCAAIYTQTTDVEIEVNGVMTYDRAVIKLDEARVRPLHEALRGPPPRVESVVPTAREAAVEWRYTFDAPAADWTAAGFDDTGWSRGRAGFGTEGTPGAVVGTRWDGPAIWLRRAIEIPAGTDPATLWLEIHHDEDVEVFVDGRRIAALDGWTGDYVMIPLDAAARAQLQPGRHRVAVHCRQTRGGQFVDLGLSSIRPR
jgi:hypothetical protein